LFERLSYPCRPDPAGTVDLIQRAYPGTEIRADGLHFEPLRATVEQVAFGLNH
jgi:hypothetical protein